MREFHELDEREVLSLAISVERANTKRFETLAGLFEGYDDKVHLLFCSLRDEEVRHTQLLEEEWQRRHGQTPLCLVDESDVREVIECVDLEDGENAIFDDVDLPSAIRLVEKVEHGAWRFYLTAAENTSNPGLKALYLDLAAMEQEHAGRLGEFTAVGGQGVESTD